MTAATITPLPDGRAVFELNGMTHVFPNWRAASAEADLRRIRWTLARFPNPSADVAALASSS